MNESEDDEQTQIEEKLKEEIIKKGLNPDIFERIKNVKKSKDINEWVKELETKLNHYKDFQLVRKTMSQFYQNKLSNSI